MQTLHQRGVNVISLGQLVDGLTNGEPLPDRSVVLTFDDGFENVYQLAFPILQQYGFPATVFLVAGYCGKTNHWPSQPSGIPRLPIMTWEQIQEMDRADIEFGAHTHNHPRLDRVSGSELTLEVVNAKIVLEDHLGHQVDHFSYPYGMRRFIPQDVVCYCRDIGFETIAHGIPCLQHSPDPQPFMINRSGWKLNLPIAANIAVSR